MGRRTVGGSSGSRQRWAAVIVLCLGQFMIVLDSTVVNVALPVIQTQLHFSPASLAWVLNAYLLTFGGLLLLVGRIGDLVGRSRVFQWGLAAFTMASMLCGLAPNASLLIAARFLQGATAAMVAPMVLGIISTMFTNLNERMVALSIFAFVAIGGASIGLVIGGVITGLLGWHWIFFINVPVGVAALVAGRIVLERDAGVGIGAGADVLGALLVTGSPALAVYGLVNAGRTAWGSPRTVWSLVGAVVLALLFVVVESKVTTPLIPLAILRHRNLSSAAIVRMFFPIGGFGFNFLGALYLQKVLGYSPLRTGLAFLPNSALTGIISLAVLPPLMKRVPAKTVALAGLILVTAGLLSMTRISAHGDYISDVLPAMALTGVGLGLFFMPSVSIAMSDVSPPEAGLASGVANMSVQMGASLGLAALATVSASRTAGALTRHRHLADALTSGYRLGFFVAACGTTLSFLAAVVLLRTGPYGPVVDATLEASTV